LICLEIAAIPTLAMGVRKRIANPHGECHKPNHQVKISHNTQVNWINAKDHGDSDVEIASSISHRGNPSGNSQTTKQNYVD